MMMAANEPIDEFITVSGNFRVMSERCARCLFSANPLVSAERRAEILEECRKEGAFFVCHEKAIDGGSACCKGFFDAGGFGVAAVQIAERLGWVEFIEPQKTIGVSSVPD